MGLFGRTTKFKAEDGFVYQVLVKTSPGMFLKKHLVISQGQCGYLPYSTVHMPHNRDIEVIIYLYIQGVTEKITLINPLVIRDSAAILLRMRDGRVTYEHIEGNLIARMSIVVKLGELGKRWKLFGKQKLDAARKKFDRLVTTLLVPEPLLPSL